MISFKKGLAGTIATIVSLAASHAAILAGIGEPTGTIRSDTYPGAGFGFYAPVTGTTINQLGFWDEGGDGLLSDHTIALYSYNGNGYDMVISVTVPAGTAATLDNGFRWVTIPDLVLPNNGQGADYYLLMASQNQDAWTDGIGGTMNPAIGTFASRAFIADTSTLAAPTFSINGAYQASPYGFGGANIGYVPEASSATLSLAAVGMLALRRRRC